MQKFITVTSDFKVREVVEANVAVGFLVAPRDDIQVGDTLTEYEKMRCGLIPWDAALVPPSEPPSDP